MRDRRVVILAPDKTRRCGVDRILPGLLPCVSESTIVAGTGAPYDINLIQSHKTLAHVCEGVRDGGTIVLAAECPEGAGHPDFVQHGSAREMARALRADYRVYRQTAWALRAKAERWRIVRVTRCEPPPGIRRVGSLEEAALLTRGRGAIVPNGPATWVTRTRRPP